MTPSEPVWPGAPVQSAASALGQGSRARVRAWPGAVRRSARPGWHHRADRFRRQAGSPGRAGGPVPQARTPLNLMREPATAGRVTNIELFFDLVYVFAVTQLSHYLLAHASVTGALEHRAAAGHGVAAVGLHHLGHQLAGPGADRGPAAAARPDRGQPGDVRRPARRVLLARAGRRLHVRGHAGRPQRVHGDRAARPGRCSATSSASCAGAWSAARWRVAGGFAAGGARVALWVAAVGVDLLGGAVGFYTPGLGRSTTHEWTIEGGHFAERCQAFVLIALGESIVVIGATLSGLAHIGAGGDRRVRRGADRQRGPVVAVLRPQRGRRRAASSPPPTTRGGSAARPTTSCTRSWWPGSSSPRPPTR